MLRACRAPVIKILPHSMVDGPGNRTVVFFQGCNLTCKYCHNPETQALCCLCGVCAEQCPAGAIRIADSRVIWDEKKCVRCDSCIRLCPNHSSPKVKAMTVAEVMAQVTANLPFIRGITVSGGECALYPEFVRELFARCQAVGLTCLMDTNGTIPIWNDEVMNVCDGVMLDVKAWSDERFLALTGAHNAIVKQNLRELARLNKLAELRIVCLDGWVDAEAAICGIAESIPETQRVNIILKLIRFRNAGVRGRLAEVPTPSLGYMARLKEIAVSCSFASANIRIV